MLHPLSDIKFENRFLIFFLGFSSCVDTEMVNIVILFNTVILSPHYTFLVPVYLTGPAPTDATDFFRCYINILSHHCVHYLLCLPHYQSSFAYTYV